MYTKANVLKPISRSTVAGVFNNPLYGYTPGKRQSGRGGPEGSGIGQGPYRQTQPRRKGSYCGMGVGADAYGIDTKKDLPPY